MEAYKRVVLTSDVSYQKVHSLLLTCIRSPQHAAAVEELVYDLSSWPSRPAVPAEYLARIQDLPEGNDLTLLRTAIAKCGLNEAAKKEWLNILRSASPECLTMYQQTVLPNRRGLSVPDHPGHPDYLGCAVAILCITCPNITSLVYGDGSSCELLEKFLRRNNYGLLEERCLEKLRQVTILEDLLMDDDRYYADMDFIGLFRFFHRLPSLQSVSLAGANVLDGVCLGEFPPATSDLQELHIKHCAYGSDLLSVALRIPRALHAISLTTGGRTVSDGSYQQCYPMTIGKALLDHRRTLCKLDVDMDGSIDRGCRPKGSGNLEDIPDADYEDIVAEERDEWWDRDLAISRSAYLRTWHMPTRRNYGYTIGSLHDFGALKHLKIGVKFLIDGGRNENGGYHEAPFRLIDILPAGLESFTLRGYTKNENSYWDAQVEEFMRLKSDRLPNLKEIRGIDTLVPSSIDVDEDDVDEDDVEYDEDESMSGYHEAGVEDVWGDAQKNDDKKDQGKSQGEAKPRLQLYQRIKYKRNWIKVLV